MSRPATARLRSVERSALKIRAKLRANRRAVLFTALILPWLAACGSSESPAETSPGASAPGEARVSVVSTPVRVPLEQIRLLADRQLSGEIYSEDRQIAAGTDMHIVLTRRDAPLVMSLDGETLSTSVPLNIRGNVSVGLGPFRVERPEGFDADVLVHLATRVRLDPDWTVVADSTTAFDIERAEITVPGIRLSAPELVEEILNRNSERIAGPLDAYLASLDIRGMLEPVWQGFRQPIEVSVDPSVWLRIEPVGFSLTPPSGSADDLRFDIQMRMFANSTVGSRPADYPPAPIPPIEEAEGTAGGFRIEIPITVELDEANRFISAEIEGREDAIGDAATIRWLGVELSGEGDRLAASVDFEAETGYWFLERLAGQMRVEGRPDYDPAARTLKVAEMDYELDTDSLLARVAEWLLHERLREKVQAELVFPLDTVVEDIRETLARELASVPLGQHGTLEATIETLEPQSVRVVGSAVELNLAASGQLSIRLQIPLS